VLDDYTKHYDIIINEKEQQILAFEKILEHLEKLNSATLHSVEEMQSLKKDQRYLLEKIGFIKKEINEITR